MTLTPVDQVEHQIDAGDIEVIAVDVWAAYLQSPGDEPLVPAGAPLSGQDDVMRATVSVHGAWRGEIAVLLGPATAASVAEAMLGGQPDLPDDIADAVGELVNVIGGNVKSLMPSPSVLGLPMVETGTLSGFPVVEAVQAWTVDLEWGDRPLRIDVRAVEQGHHMEQSEEEVANTR